VSTTLFVRPSFVLEHLEHRHILRIDGVAFDGLEIHPFEAAPSRGGDVSFARAIQHVSSLPDAP
jgi:hypothetical protein